jgi:hypothetical protein
MKKNIIIILILTLCCISIYGIDDTYNLSLADVGFGNYNFKNAGLYVDMFNFSWVEKNTGLGLGFHVMSIYFSLNNKEEFHASFPSFEIMWNPLSKRLGALYGTLGIYNKFGRNIDGGFINTTGIRYIFSVSPYGRTKDEGFGGFCWRLGSVFVEYSTTRTLIIGISASPSILFYLPLLLFSI